MCECVCVGGGGGVRARLLSVYAHMFRIAVVVAKERYTKETSD